MPVNSELATEVLDRELHADAIFILMFLAHEDTACDIAVVTAGRTMARQAERDLSLPSSNPPMPSCSSPAVWSSPCRAWGVEAAPAAPPARHHPGVLGSSLQLPPAALGWQP
jgi:hypothetical protein